MGRDLAYRLYYTKEEMENNDEDAPSDSDCECDYEKMYDVSRHNDELCGFSGSKQELYKRIKELANRLPNPCNESDDEKEEVEDDNFYDPKLSNLYREILEAITVYCKIANEMYNHNFVSITYD